MSNQEAIQRRTEDREALLRCRLCGTYSSERVQTRPSDGLPSTLTGRCHGMNGGCGEVAVHDILEGVRGYPVRWRVYCPECGYETLVWDGPDYYGPHCPECSPEGSVTDLIEVSGVSASKAARLADHDIETIEALRATTQQGLTRVEGIGNALAARIKADVGSPEDPKEVDNYDPPKLDVDRVWWRFEADHD